MTSTTDGYNSLTIQAIIPVLQNALFAALDNGTTPEQHIASLSSAIARLFNVLAEDGISLRDTVAPMANFVAAFKDRAELIEAGDRGRLVKGKTSGGRLWYPVSWNGKLSDHRHGNEEERHVSGSLPYTRI